MSSKGPECDGKAAPGARGPIGQEFEYYVRGVEICKFDLENIS